MTSPERPDNPEAAAQHFIDPNGDVFAAPLHGGELTPMDCPVVVRDTLVGTSVVHLNQLIQRLSPTDIIFFRRGGPAEVPARPDPPDLSERRSSFVDGRLIIDRGRRLACVDGEERPLGKRQFLVLSLLLEHAGVLVTPEQFFENCWMDSKKEPSAKTVQGQIYNVRRKIRPFDKNIVSGLNAGYLFDETLRPSEA